MGVLLGDFMRPCGTEAGKCEFSRRPFSPRKQQKMKRVPGGNREG